MEQKRSGEVFKIEKKKRMEKKKSREKVKIKK